MYCSYYTQHYGGVRMVLHNPQNRAQAKRRLYYGDDSRMNCERGLYSLEVTRTHCCDRRNVHSYNYTED